MDREHLKKIDNVLEQLVKDKFAPGAMALILEDGKEAYFGAAGNMDEAAGKKMSRDTIIRLYSMSKPVTAFAAMLLVEDGVIDLDNPVGDFIPTYKNQTYADRYNQIPVRRPMRIRDLLNMSSGLCYNGILNSTEVLTDRLIGEGVSRIGTDNEMSTMELAERLGEIPLLFSPGEGYNYSFSADVLGAVIEKASGMSFGEFVHKRILDPLGMTDTDYYCPPEKQHRLAKVYTKNGDGLMEYDYNHLMINLKGDHAPLFESGGAGLFTTLDDYAKFATMLLNGGEYNGVRIAGSQTVKFMTEASMEELPKKMLIKNDGDSGYEYCNLCRIMKDPSKAITLSSKGEYGWDGWLGPYFINDPVNKVTILVGMQLTGAGTTGYTRKIRNIVYSSL